MASQDLTSRQLATPQNAAMQTPLTIVGAATVAPQTLLTFVSGTIGIATITPPESGQHILLLIFTDAAPGGLLTTGNIKAAVTATTNVPVLAVYDPVTAKYWAGTLKAS